MILIGLESFVAAWAKLAPLFRRECVQVWQLAMLAWLPGALEKMVSWFSTPIALLVDSGDSPLQGGLPEWC